MDADIGSVVSQVSYGNRVLMLFDYLISKLFSWPVSQMVPDERADLCSSAAFHTADDQEHAPARRGPF